jgi:hypothetical protein
MTASIWQHGKAKVIHMATAKIPNPYSNNLMMYSLFLKVNLIYN